MSRSLLNFWLDAAMLVTLAFVLWVSAVLQVVFPAPASTQGWQLWGLSFEQWRDVQFGSLCLFALLTVEHLVLHWNWICGVIATQVLRSIGRPDEATQALYGVGGFIGVLILMLASVLAALFSVKGPSL